jgi:hypothetical protein
MTIEGRDGSGAALHPIPWSSWAFSLRVVSGSQPRTCTLLIHRAARAVQILVLGCCLVCSISVLTSQTTKYLTIHFYYNYLWL